MYEKIKKNIVIGSGGHARSLISILLRNNKKNISIKSFSKIKKNEKIFNKKLEKLDPIKDFKENCDYYLAIGSIKQRVEYFIKLKKKNRKMPNIISKSANYNKTIKIGNGNFLGENIFIGPFTCIGSNNILNTSCSIDHECHIGDNCNISPGVVLAGRVKLGNNIFIGMGACIADNIKIVNNVIIGANSFVNKSILKPGKYFGNPIRKVT